jgi:hypothetical protein
MHAATTRGYRAASCANRITKAPLAEDLRGEFDYDEKTIYQYRDNGALSGGASELEYFPTN